MQQERLDQDERQQLQVDPPRKVGAAGGEGAVVVANPTARPAVR